MLSLAALLADQSHAECVRRGNLDSLLCFNLLLSWYFPNPLPRSRSSLGETSPEKKTTILEEKHSLYSHSNPVPGGKSGLWSHKVSQLLPPACPPGMSNSAVITFNELQALLQLCIQSQLCALLAKPRMEMKHLVGSMEVKLGGRKSSKSASIWM